MLAVCVRKMKEVEYERMRERKRKKELPTIAFANLFTFFTFRTCFAGTPVVFKVKYHNNRKP